MVESKAADDQEVAMAGAPNLPVISAKMTGVIRLAAMALVLCGIQVARGQEYDQTCPHRFFRLELGSVGYDVPFDARLQVLKLEFLGGPFRVGASYVDGWFSDIGEDEGSGFIAPVYVGYTIMSKPHKQGLGWGHNYEIYAQAEAAFLGVYADLPMVNVTLCADADGWGTGVGAEVGYAFNARTTTSGNYQQSMVHAGIRLRLLTLALGF